MKRAAIIAPLLILAACSDGTSTGAPPGEDRALDEAAASLDANTINTNAAEIVDEDDGGNESQPE